MTQMTNSGAFDSKIWKEQRGKNERKNPRIEMVIELGKRHLRKGMTRAEVHALLGEPDQKHGTSDVYELGASPVGVDFEYYILDYENELLSNFRITRS